MNRGSREDQWKVKVRLRQCKHNLNLNYNLMGFPKIGIIAKLIKLFEEKLTNKPFPYK